MNAPVYVNGRFLKQRLTGVQRYAWEICRRLRTQKKIEFLSPPSLCGTSRVAAYLWEQAALPCTVPRGRVFWSPTGSGPFLMKRHVLTLHDGAVLSHPEWFSTAFVLRRRWLLPRLLRSACKVITVSHFAKRHICAHADVRADDVAVIYNGVDQERFRPASEASIRQTREALRLPPRYVLGLGSLEPRKNFRGLLRAWSRAQEHLAGSCELVIAGGGGRNFRDVALRTSSPHVRFLGYVPDAHLPALYSGAAAFAYPSVFEGFGLPVLEAMACGTPVVTSTTSSLPEVAGDAAVLVDPLDVEAVAEGIVSAVEERALRRRLRRKGLARARSFTWERAAAETWRVLSEVAA